MLLQTFVYRFSSEYLLSILWGAYQGVELLGCVVIRCLTYKDLQADVSLQDAFLGRP